MTKILAAVLGAFLLLAAQPLSAAWYEASSDHFVIYADDKERDIRQFAENLERYHSAMAYLTGRLVDKPSPSNRVVIYVVGDQRAIRKLAGGRSRNIAGFYIPRAGGSRAFVQDIRNQKGYPHFSTIVLLHEYAHHFLLSSTRVAYPRWLSEGAAEFYAASTFKDDGSMIVGGVAQHRAAELFRADPVPVRELLDPDLYAERGNAGRDAFYGKSWLMYHYLIFAEDREGQLDQYQRHLINGMTSIEAGEAAFGDLDVLERDLKAYMRAKLVALALPADKLSVGPIAIRPLTAGEAAIMDVQIQSHRGVTQTEAEELVIEARAIAARFPDDPGVLAALAEAEYDAGFDEAAIAAADRAIAIDPGRTNPYIQKGYAMFRQARAAEAEDKAKAFAAAMEPFQALNKLENDHPLPLAYYYRSFAERRVVPNETARAALERAATLAPFDHELQLNAGTMLIREGKHILARGFLRPVAFNPHGGGMAERAKRLIARIDSFAEGAVPGADSVLDETESADLSGAEAETGD